MIPLGLLSPGEHGEIVEVRLRKTHCTGHCREEREKSDVRVEDMGLRVGKRVEMLTNGGGPVLVKVDESRIAVARGMAMKIMVRR
ncbi:FeoA family protein [Geobacter sp.]|uniref:FeoA family protein n=1 Tax=Geobacter sp. TaxID=46610 RepID=UPI00261C8B01|nr:FeoA family protein [Geobacter sp.]